MQCLRSPDAVTMSSPYSSKDRDTLTLLPCKLCLEYVPLEHTTTISQCLCVFCILCLKWYIELSNKEGLQTGISCLNSANYLRIRCVRDRRLQFEREVLLDPCRTWCPSCSYQAVCQLQEAELPMPQLVKCPLSSLRFCSACHADWHTGQTCQGPLPIGTS
ncbi:probable E3 ubiquitin-protein ligase RNF144A-B [Tachysurus ichikawai]